MAHVDGWSFASAASVGGRYVQCSGLITMNNSATFRSYLHFAVSHVCIACDARVSESPTSCVEQVLPIFYNRAAFSTGESSQRTVHQLVRNSRLKTATRHPDGPP